MVRDENDGHAGLAVQPLDGIEHLAPPLRVEHGGRLVEHDTLRPHGEHARDGHTLLLSAGQELRGVGTVIVHADGFERVVDAPPDLRGGDAEVFRRKGDVFFYDIRDDLVIGVLEHHADMLPDGEKLFFVLRIHAVDRHAAARGQQDGVKMLGKRRLAAAVMAEHGDKAPLLDGQVQAVKYNMRLAAVLALVSIMQVVYLNRCGHGFSFVQRHVAPHGRARPVSRTGRPSSSDWV